MSTKFLLGLDESEQWRKWLIKAGCHDVYFFPEYARSWSNVEQGTSQLFVYESEGNVFIYPFRRRSFAQVEGLSDFSDWYDITSDYGYGGPFVSLRKEGSPSDFMIQAISALDETCRERNIVSEFCRFHPLLANFQYVEAFYQPINCTRTAWIDLTLSPEEIWRQIRKGHRYDLRKAEKKGVEILIVSGIEDSLICYDLYIQTMKDINASRYYYFNRDLFESTIRLLSEYVVIFLAKYQGKTTAASMFIYGDRFFHYHFSGMDRRFAHITPNKLLLFRAALWAKEKGLEKFHLGGGYGGSDEGSLMLFKTGFTKLRANFYAAKRIHNEGIYRDACRAVGVHPETIPFFPAYRAKFRDQL